MFLADAVVETHDRIVGRTYREAARTCDAQLGNETASVREALRAFAELGTALIGAKDTGEALDAVIADGPGWEGLGDLVARAAALANTVAADPLNHVLGGYSRFRRYTPRMLRTLDIEASPVAKQTSAIRPHSLLASNRPDLYRSQYLPDRTNNRFRQRLNSCILHRNNPTTDKTRNNFRLRHPRESPEPLHILKYRPYPIKMPPQFVGLAAHRHALVIRKQSGNFRVTVRRCQVFTFNYQHLPPTRLPRKYVNIPRITYNCPSKDLRKLNVLSHLPPCLRKSQSHRAVETMAFTRSSQPLVLHLPRSKKRAIQAPTMGSRYYMNKSRTQRRGCDDQ